MMIHHYFVMAHFSLTRPLSTPLVTNHVRYAQEPAPNVLSSGPWELHVWGLFSVEEFTPYPANNCF